MHKEGENSNMTENSSKHEQVDKYGEPLLPGFLIQDSRTNMDSTLNTKFGDSFYPSILVTNPQSLVNSFTEFTSLVEKESPDVITVSETWFSSNHPADEFVLETYKMFNDDRENRRGGGVALYIKKSLQPSVPDIKVPPELECIWGCLFDRIFLCSLYHAPRAVTGSLLIDHIVNTVIDLRKRIKNSLVIVMGDFNEINGDRLNACVGLKNIVDLPTHGNSTIDLILTDAPSKYLTPVLLPPLGNSHHHCVMVHPLSSCST